MNEREVVKRLGVHLRRDLPGCVVLKHRDDTTAGIPDLTVTYRPYPAAPGGTHWVEVKYVREGEAGRRLYGEFDQRQLATCFLLDAQGACRYFVAYDRGDGELWASVVRPRDVRDALEYYARRDEIGLLRLSEIINRGITGSFAHAAGRLATLIRGWS